MSLLAFVCAFGTVLGCMSIKDLDSDESRGMSVKLVEFADAGGDSDLDLEIG